MSKGRDNMTPELWGRIKQYNNKFKNIRRYSSGAYSSVLAWVYGERT